MTATWKVTSYCALDVKNINIGYSQNELWVGGGREKRWTKYVYFTKIEKKEMQFNRVTGNSESLLFLPADGTAVSLPWALIFPA